MAIVDLLSAVVSGDEHAADALTAVAVDDVVAAASEHGVVPLIADRLAGTSRGATAVGIRLVELGQWQAAADMLREVELRRLLPALADAGADALVIKGAQLAYDCYPRPDLRPRIDTDLMVSLDGRHTANDVLIALGYDPPEHVSGDVVMYQASYVLNRDGVAIHTVDVHWRIANPQLFAGLLTFEELRATSVPLRQLGRAARGLSNVHALLLACIHRVAHHFDSDCLIWLYDIHLLSERMTRDDWNELAAVARERRVSIICRQGVERAVSTFGTVGAEAFLSRDVSDAEADEPTAAYLRRDRRPVDNFLADAKALPRWSDRLRLVKEHVFPPSRYMHDVYAPSSRAPLPVLYARRVWRGARRWLTRS